MDQQIGKVFQLIAIVAFIYGTLTTFLQPILPENLQILFFPRWFFDFIPPMVVVFGITGILIYLNQKTQKKK